MRRYTALKNLIPILEDNDIAIFVGNEMCKEAYQYDRSTNIYLKNYHGFGLSVALGLAMTVDKRVFVFVGEGDLLRQFSVLIQTKASLCPNIFIVLLDNGGYQSAGNLPNIIEAVKSMKAIVFNIGLLVFDFTSYFRTKKWDFMKGFMKNIRGPMFIIIKVGAGIKKNLPDVDISEEAQKERLMEFLKDENAGTSLYQIPVDTPILNIDNVKELKIGGSS